ncbi:MAG: hypothetical protein Q8R24_09930 [Legionellaceae bacterium]|nr:hypothetical protein [Legionellaceae bacterium]
MPILEPNKCYAYQKQRLITTPTTLPPDWLTGFYALLAMQLQLDDKRAVFEGVDYATNQIGMLTAKEKFFKELDRHAGERSTYTFKSELLESLAKLYVVFTTNEQKNFIASRIAEDVGQCTPGFHDRMNFIIISLNMPQNLDELLAQLRFNLVDKIAHQLADQSAQGIHVHARVNKIARAAGFGIWAINEKDSYERAGSSNITDETIEQKVQEGFKNHFQFFAIINALCEDKKALIAPLGYNGKRQADQEYDNGEDDKFFEVLSLFISIDNGIAFERNAGKVSDIDWQYVKTLFLQKLREEAYVLLSIEETVLLDGLLRNETMLCDANSLSQLIPHGYELAECLQFFSFWSKEQKAGFVLTYLQTKAPHEQKEILAILHNEVPQLTAELETQANLQAMYFAIAIDENEIAAVRTYIEHGADINQAILLLFSQVHKSDTLYWLHDNPNLLQKLTVASLNTVVSQGKYQGRTIAETLVSTKKGRQLLWENTSLQHLFSQSDISNVLNDTLKQAQIERNTLPTEVGFFKKPNPIVLLLVQAIVYGDLKKSEELLQAHPYLLKPLLTEKVTVQDYSRRKVKQKTAFQAALCAMDDELCAMLAKYMTEEDMQNQYQDIFPTGHKSYYATQAPFDFSQIINAIHLSNDEDIQKALSLELPNTTELWGNLVQFRANFTQHSCQEAVFNPQHLIEAFELYDRIFYQCSLNQCDLFWRQVVGYVQRFLPANIAMDVAQGLYYRVEVKEPARRSFNFRVDGGAIYPVAVGSFGGLGFESGAGAAGSATRRWGAPARARSFRNLCQSKTTILGELCSQTRPTVIYTV